MRQIKIGAVALAAIAVLASCSDGDEAATDSDTDGEETTTSAPEPDYSPLPEGSAALEPGDWAVQAEGPSTAPLAVFDVPAGFYGGGPNIWTNQAVIGYWTVDGVYEDPCSDSGSAPSIGPSVQDLSAALKAQQMTTTTKPVPVSVGGHDGVYLELATPADLNYGTCHHDTLYIANESPHLGESTVTRLWILDVDGQRVLISLGGDARDADETIRQFSGIVRHATFVEEG